MKYYDIFKYLKKILKKYIMRLLTTITELPCIFDYIMLK